MTLDLQSCVYKKKTAKGLVLRKGKLKTKQKKKKEIRWVKKMYEKSNDRMGHQNWLVINKEKNNAGKWQKQQLQSFRNDFASRFFRDLQFFRFLRLRIALTSEHVL